MTSPFSPDVGEQTARIAANDVSREIARRRTFAIISHPDAGKTTLTEKLLLYSGQVQEAGAVRGRKTQRAVRSDWMQMERERGISVTSTVLSFENDGTLLNLLDTPGHQDFSEDTYRTLTAVDSAVMVIDAVKGIEAQTRKLFAICAARKIPILTFVNKMDRPGCEPLKTLSEIEQVLGIHAVPLNWPIGSGRDFRGVYDLRSRKAVLFRTVPQGSIRVPTEECAVEDIPEDELWPDRRKQLRDEIDLLEHAGEPFDRERFLKGEVTPVFFGSALTNFGVEIFLNSFIDLAPPPGPRLSDQGMIPPDRPEFSGVVFKIQANLDPRHHDCVAFLRVCSGTFTRDMEAVLARTGDRIRIKRSQRLFANERETMDSAFPGDVVGLTLPGQLRLGDTLGGNDRLTYLGQWQFPPECFATLACTDTARRKQFDKGLQQLVEEGAIQLFRDPVAPTVDPVLAAVGQLQFDVVQFRLETEYNARTNVRMLPYRFARWVTGPPDDLDKLRVPSLTRMLQDDTGVPVVLFESEGMLRYARELNPTLTFVDSRPAPAAS
jgi:peptide chain release factor 3